MPTVPRRPGRRGSAPQRAGRRTFARAATTGLIVALFSVTACATSTSSGAASRAHARYYVSLGDSYAVGFQPSPVPGATSGYTGTIAHALHLRLANFGCGGATTTSILKTVGCATPYGPTASSGAVAYPHQTQAAAADAFLRRHRGQVGLVTVSIGGNDITQCAAAGNPTTCVLSALPKVRHNVQSLASQLRAAAGRRVPIIGLTYPDVLLGLWVYPPGHTNQALATLSVTAFRDLVNPAFASAYRAAGVRFLNVTEVTDGYEPLSRRTTLAPYGSVPVAVARTCTLTWYCQEGNIHATTAGYALIGRAVVASYRSLAH